MSLGLGFWPQPGWLSGFLILLLQASFFGNWLVLALCLLRRRKARSASLFCALAALLRLLLPLPLQSPISLHRLWMGPQREMVAAVQFSDGRLHALSGTAEAAGLLPAFFILLWAAGAAGTGTAFAVGYWRQRRQLQLCIPLPASSPISQAVRTFAKGYGIPVYTCENILAPLAAGVLRPRILIPSGMALTEELRFALMHEAEHIRRGHNLLKLLMLLACCLHWFNPLCWQLKRALGEELELSCDRRALKNLGAQARAPYARALLHFYAREPSPAFASGFGGGAAEERIRQIMSYHPQRGRTFLAGLFVLLLFSVLAALPAATLYSVTVTAASMGDAGWAQLQEDALSLEVRDAAAAGQESEMLTAVDEALLYGSYVVTAGAEAQEGTKGTVLLKFLFPFSAESSRDDAAAVQQEAASAGEAILYLVEETVEAGG